MPLDPRSPIQQHVTDRPTFQRRRSSAFEYNPVHWSPGYSDADSYLAAGTANLSVLGRHTAVRVPRMRSTSPAPPSPRTPIPPTPRENEGLAVEPRPILRRSSPSPIYLARPPSPLPAAPADDLPTSLAAASDRLHRLVEQSNAYVSALMSQVNALQQCAAGLTDAASAEQLTALFNSRPEFADLEVHRCVGLNLPMATWQSLVRSILDENAFRTANTALEEQAPGNDLLAGVLYWRARNESEALGLIRISQRRHSVDSTTSQRRSSLASQTSSSRQSSASENNTSRRTTGTHLEQHLPSTQE